MNEKLLTKRRFKDGDHEHRPWVEEIFTADASHKCPTYVHRAPPCQASCPSGEDIRGWLNIVRGIEKPPAGNTLAGICFQPGDRCQSFPGHHGQGLPGAV